MQKGRNRNIETRSKQTNTHLHPRRSQTHQRALPSTWLPRDLPEPTTNPKARDQCPHSAYIPASPFLPISQPPIKRYAPRPRTPCNTTRTYRSPTEERVFRGRSCERERAKPVLYSLPSRAFSYPRRVSEPPPAAFLRSYPGAPQAGNAGTPIGSIAELFWRDECWEVGV